MLRKIAASVFVVLLMVSTACNSNQSPQVDIKLSPLSEMPKEVRQASSNVQKAYQFNIANPDVMQEIPCYCGCGAIGHHSNFNCYAKFNEDGSMSYDGHALGCSICVDITLDTIRLMEKGKDVAEIQAYVNDVYSRYGLPTTPLQND